MGDLIKLSEAKAAVKTLGVPSDISRLYRSYEVNYVDSEGWSESLVVRGKTVSTIIKGLVDSEKGTVMAVGIGPVTMYGGDRFMFLDQASESRIKP